MKDVLEAAQAKDTGRRVKLLRRQLGWSQPQLAQFLDCTVESISKTERGLHMMKSWRLAKLCRLCGVSMDFMIFGIDPNDTSIVPPYVVEAYHSADEVDREILAAHIQLAIRMIRLHHDPEEPPKHRR